MLGYQEDGANLVLVAMNGWADPEPAWWLNLQAHPDATVDLATGSRDVTARLATGGRALPPVGTVGRSLRRPRSLRGLAIARDRDRHPGARAGNRGSS